MDTNKEAILFLRNKANEHKRLYEVYNKTANELEGESYSSISSSSSSDVSIRKDNRPITKRVIAKRGGHTFKETIVQIFNKEIPYTGKQVFDKYCRITGNELKYSAFSAQLSVLKNKHNILNMHKIKENPINSRFIYGRSEWFDGDKLMKKYFERIRLE